MATAENIEAAGRFETGGDLASPIIQPRRRLFRKYALLFVALVGTALLINSGFDFWFSYQENKDALLRVQQEKADAAAGRIAEFVDEIERQIGWTTHAQWASAPLDQRLQDYFRLLRQEPPITVVASVANNAPASGNETVQVSGGGDAAAPASVAAATTIAQAVDLNMAAAHAGSFAQGDSADTYTLTVSNVKGPNSTVGGPSQHLQSSCDASSPVLTGIPVTSPVMTA